MAFVQNFPFFCIILSMFSAIISFVMNGRVAKYIHVAMVTAVLILSLATLSFVVGTGESYTFMMGHFPAPWGNEIRIGELEARNHYSVLHRPEMPIHPNVRLP